MSEREQNDEEAGSGRESHRERSIRMRAVRLLANALVGLEPGRLAMVPLGPELVEAVIACRSFTKNARARQLRRIGSLLRASDLPPIEAAVQEIRTGRGDRSRREQLYEQWRTRLLCGGDGEMTAFVRAHPGADVQVLRQCVRQAVRAPESPRGKGAARELLRHVRTLGETALLRAAEQRAAAGEDDPDAAVDVEPDDVDEDADADDDDADGAEDDADADDKP